jgi:hypothetical protein
MALQFDNTTIRRKNPIKRNNKFFGKEDYDLQINFSQEYLEQWANQTVILYQVDLSKTQVNDTYKEAKKDAIRFKPPVELTVIYEIQDAEMKTYNTQQMKGYYVKTGKLVFSVLLRTLEEMDCDINRGDYIGIQITPEHMEYFTVADDGRVGAFSNKFTMYGTVPYARTITCASVDPNEFNG